MNTLKNKLKSKAGESLAEALAAILIFTLASVALFTMVDASNNVNRTAKEKDQFVQSQMVTAEKAEGSVADGTAVKGSASLQFKNTAGTTMRTETIEVYLYGDTTDGLYSYFKEEAPE